VKTRKMLFCLLLISVAVMMGCSYPGGTNSGGADGQSLTCIDAHSQPPYPELGDGVDLEGIIASMDASHVAVSILSARTEMRYSMEIASFAAAHPDRIIAAVSLKLSSMGPLSAAAGQAIAYDNAARLWKIGP